MLQAFVGDCGVDASATLQIMMRRYDNPTGRDYEGECCDRRCRNGCDHYFRFALDRFDRYRCILCYVMIVQQQ